MHTLCSLTHQVSERSVSFSTTTLRFDVQPSQGMGAAISKPSKRMSSMMYMHCNTIQSSTVSVEVANAIATLYMHMQEASKLAVDSALDA